MKKAIYLLFSLSLFYFPGAVKSQKIEIIYTEESLYPRMITAFRIFDQDGNEIRQDISKDDIIIEEMENGQILRRYIKNVECPNSALTTNSVIFSIDLSTSMAGSFPESGIIKLDAIKSGILSYIEAFDPKRNEIGLTGFCSHAISNKDNPDLPVHPLSIDKLSLRRTVESLTESDLCAGTNYNAAFLHQRNQPHITQLSALHNCRPDVRKYKPIIIFITDGDHLPEWDGVGPFDIGEVGKLAFQYNASIYVIHLGDEAFDPTNINYLMALASVGNPPSKGIWLNVNSAGELYGILGQIYEESKTIGDPPPCYLEWEAACDGASATITFPNTGNISEIIDYNVDDKRKPELTFEPEELTINSIKPGESAAVDITLTARNNYAVINGLEFLKDINA